MIPQYRTLKLKLPKYRMKKSPIMRRRASHLGRFNLWNNGRRATQLGRPSENRFTLKSSWRVFFLVLQLAVGGAVKQLRRVFWNKMQLLRRKQFLRLLLRILAREKCFFSKAISEEGGDQCGVRGNECRTASGGWWVGLKLKNFWICDCEKLVTRQTQSD